MLEFFRTKASSWITKIILGLIILSFCYYGLSGLFQSSGRSHAVATVGNINISKQEFFKELQKTLQAVQKETGKKLSLRDLYQTGIVHQLLERNIDALLIAQEIERLKITTPDDMVMDVIQKDPMFSENGKFSRKKFDLILAANHMKEAYFVNSMRQKLAKVQLLTAISQAGYTPNTLIDAFFSTILEKRTVSVLVPVIKVDSAKINDAEIEKLYNETKHKFRTPEYRSFKVLIVDPALVAKNLHITDAELKAAYEQQKETFYDEDRRDVLMIRVQDTKEAATVKDLIKQGKVNTLVDAIPLKGATRGSFPDEHVADIAFKLPLFGTSSMVHIAAMHQNFVLYVQNSIPGSVKPFSQVKSQVREELKRQKSMDDMENLTRAIEDKLAANVSFGQLAQEHHLKLLDVRGVNNKGIHKNGTKPQEGLNEDILKTAFETKAKMDSAIVEVEDMPLFVVHVDAVEPSITPPLTSIKPQIQQLLTRKLAMEASEAQTKKIMTALGSGKTLVEISKTMPSAVHTFTINPSDPKTIQALDKRSLLGLFSLAQGSYIPIVFANQLALGQVIKIMPANKHTQKAQFDSVNEFLTTSNNQDIIQQYMKSLRKQHSVEIYTESIESLISLGESALPAPAQEMPE